MLPLLLAPVALVAPAAQPASGPAVEGWIHNEKGKPLAATVGLIPMARRAGSIPLKATESLGVPNKKKPGFRLPIPSPGLYLLDVRAKGHATLQVPVFLGAEGLTGLVISPVPDKPKGEPKPVSEDAKQARWTKLYAELRGREVKAQDARKAGSKLDLGPDAEALAAELKAETDPDTQAFLAIAYLSLLDFGTKLDPATAGLALDKLPPTSPFWAVGPRVAIAAYPAAGRHKDMAAFRDAVAKENPDPEVRAVAIYGQLSAAAREEDLEKVKGLYATLTTEYKDTYAATWAKAFDPEKLLIKGRPFPAFKVKDLEGKELTLETFQGKAVLISFWSSADKASVAEVPALQAAYTKYKDSGLEIVSASLDEKVETLKAFKDDPAHPMPWVHTFLGKDSRDALKASAGFTGVLPRVLLLGPDGKVLVGETFKLRGAYLPVTLDKVLKEAGLLKAAEAPKPAEAPKAPEAPATPEAPKAPEPPKG